MGISSELGFVFHSKAPDIRSPMRRVLEGWGAAEYFTTESKPLQKPE
jgi:hypothetical protein